MTYSSFLNQIQGRCLCCCDAILHMCCAHACTDTCCLGCPSALLSGGMKTAHQPVAASGWHDVVPCTPPKKGDSSLITSFFVVIMCRGPRQSSPASLAWSILRVPLILFHAVADAACMHGCALQDVADVPPEATAQVHAYWLTKRHVTNRPLLQRLWFEQPWVRAGESCASADHQQSL